MKKIFLTITWLCFISALVAQTTTQNFIKKTNPTTAVTSEATLNAISSVFKIESINYIDGLGRPIQDVLVKGSPNNFDIVQPTRYDQYGRQVRMDLPYTAPSNDGSFKSNFSSELSTFYNTSSKVAKTTVPFAENIFDGSPLNQLIEKTAPDVEWAYGNGHTTKFETTYNTVQEDAILLWELQPNGDYFVDGYYYADNSLTKSKTTDAQGNYAFVYTDKQGKTICTKQFLEMRIVGVNQVPYYLTTYLLYNEFGNLTTVIPPKAMDAMDASGVYSVNALTSELVFKYKYDERQRLIEKKVPGTGWSYIVYNSLNQPVLFRDANLQAQNKWSFIKYDVLGRPILSGLFNATGLANYQTRALAQAQFNLPQTAIGESETLQNASNPFGYTNVTLPNQNLDILTVNYYDDYDFDNNGVADYTFNATAIPCTQIPSGVKQVICLPYTNTVTNRTRGYLTGSKIKVLDAANPTQWENAAVFYDDNGQAIQSQSNDHLGGTDLVNMVYDFVGNVIQTQQVHTLAGQSNIQVLNQMNYDKMGRLKEVYQKNNSDVAVILSNYNYNELSQVIEKNVHKLSNAAGFNFLQSMDYRYNIHGNLTSINNIDLASDMGTNPLTGTNDDVNDLWGMQLSYNTNTSGVNGTKQYTGNVSEKKWRSVTDNIKRAYGYDYDKADRLKASTYVEYNTGPNTWSSNAGKFDEKNITYDANGNILALQRFGLQASTSTFGLIDNLTYQYNGNFLGAVNDAVATGVTTAAQMDFKDNGSTIANEYTYDGNGNKTSDPNKKITSIVYNHLNLPTLINFSTNGGLDKIEYTYDAAGTRLRKKVTTATAVTLNKSYAGQFEYTTNTGGTTTLESMQTNEGRCVPTNVTGTLIFRYEYQYTDNTGNVVMAFSDLDNNNVISPTTEVIQQSHYYAFGMRMEGIATPQIGLENKYKFGYKEVQDELGLNELDFGARFYDPAIARWGCIDPMADATPNLTPFHYCLNNPITVIDPDGMYAISDPGVDDTEVDAIKSRNRVEEDDRERNYLELYGDPFQKQKYTNYETNKGKAAHTEVDRMINEDNISKLVSQVVGGEDPYKYEQKSTKDDNSQNNKTGELNPCKDFKDNPLAVASPTNPIRKEGRKNRGRHTLTKSNKLTKFHPSYNKGFRHHKRQEDKFHFAIGIKIGKMVIFDIRWNNQKHLLNEMEYPGRIWGPKIITSNKEYRVDFFYYDWGQK